MVKGKRQKDKQYNGQMKNDKRTKNIMIKGKREKDKQVYGGHYIVFRFPLAIIFFVLLSFSFGHYILCPLSFSFGHYIVCPFVIFLWPLYCLYFCRFPLAIILFFPFVIFLWPKQYNGQRKTKNNIMAK
jgi:hypothetical protein